MRRQNLLMLDLWVAVDSSAFHASLASRLVSLVIWALSVAIVGSEGLARRRASRCWVRLRIVGERPGLQVFLCPVGIVRLDVLLMIF